MQFDKNAIPFKTLTRLLTALLGRKCHVLQAKFRRCRTSFLWHMQRANRQCWSLCFVKVLSNDSATVLCRLSRAKKAHLQLMISAAFCQLPGSKPAGGGGGLGRVLVLLQILNCPFPGLSFLFLGICASLQLNLCWTVHFLYSRSCTIRMYTEL